MNRTPHHANQGERERLRLERLDKTHATLKRGDGSTLTVPAAWLPKEAGAGDLLIVYA